MRKYFKRDQNFIKAGTYLNLSTIIIWLIFLMLYSVNASVDLPVFHLDGAFQTASGLFRLHAGQLPGKNFFPYLGVGPLLVLFPLFEIFGATIIFCFSTWLNAT